MDEKLWTNRGWTKTRRTFSVICIINMLHMHNYVVISQCRWIIKPDLHLLGCSGRGSCIVNIKMVSVSGNKRIFRLEFIFVYVHNIPGFICEGWRAHIQTNLLRIHVKTTQIRLYLPFSNLPCFILLKTTQIVNTNNKELLTTQTTLLLNQ